MSFLRLINRQRLILPLLTLAASLLFCCFLCMVRVFWYGNLGHFNFLWNLFLAWVPLLAAVRCYWLHFKDPAARWRLGLWTVIWLLFLPNSPYLFTDLIHLTARNATVYWVDLLLLLSIAWTGFMAGVLSLQLMHSVIETRAGRLAGWTAVLSACALSGFGIYLGRVLRWNSWDVLTNPYSLMSDVVSQIRNPLADTKAVVLTVLFACFTGMAYVLIYTLSRWQTVPMKNQART